MNASKTKRRNYGQAGTLIKQFDPKEKWAMPALMWIAFWSCMMGAATHWQESVMPARTKGKDRRDQPTT